MRVFKNKPFARFARRNLIDDLDLCAAVDQANHGLMGADLGGGVIKQRIARKGAGKSGGFRTIVVFKAGDLAIFVHGYGKNEVENLRSDELVALRKLAKEMLGYTQVEINEAVLTGVLIGVICDGDSETIPEQFDGLHS